jgi:hypothetical protein
VPLKGDPPVGTLDSGRHGACPYKK